VFALVPWQTTKEVTCLEETDRIRDEVVTGQGVNMPEGIPQPPTPDPYVEGLRAELEEARARGLEAHRRALLAENAGRVVPELVAGSTVEELEGSVDVARRAFDAARAAALAEVAATPIPAGNPIRQGPGVEGMSSLEKIAYGLKRD